MTGTFNGPLRRVAARMLEGYDFAMKITPQGIDVLVLGQNKTSDKTVLAATPARATPKGSPAPVMTAAEANRYERRSAYCAGVRKKPRSGARRNVCATSLSAGAPPRRRIKKRRASSRAGPRG
jgi:hypothetical protein